MSNRPVVVKTTEGSNMIAEPDILIRNFWDDISREFRDAGHADADT